MAKVFSKQEIIDAASAFVDLNNFLYHLKSKKPAANCINSPKLPERISESLAYHLISKGEIPQMNRLKWNKIRFNEKALKHVGTNSKPTDIILDLPNGDECLVEVKATQVGYTEIKKKDAGADFLIWIEFNDSFKQGLRKEVEISTLKIPQGMVAKQYNWGPYHNQHPMAVVKTYPNLSDVLNLI
jgi:hypothetical protein